MNVHIANTDFEFELSTPENSLSIQETWEKFPVCLQLQYLPFLYADRQDLIAVTQIPSDTFYDSWNLFQKETRDSLHSLSNFVLLKDPLSEIKHRTCISWGASKKIANWAKAHEVSYAIPEWEVVKEMNSKAYSFLLTPPLPGAELIENQNQLEKWVSHSHGKKVLKTCFGVSGRGHCLFDHGFDLNKIIKFCESEWKWGRPLIAEPWVDRIADFSTQWVIEETGKIELMGSTLFYSNQKGVYHATLAGVEEIVFKKFRKHLDQHKEIAERALHQMWYKGFFGNVGIDAFIYKDQNGEACLHPIVEINGRKTMSLAALLFQKKWFPDQIVRFCYGKTQENEGFSLLPDSIVNGKGEKIKFERQLVFNVVEARDLE